MTITKAQALGIALALALAGAAAAARGDDLGRGLAAPAPVAGGMAYPAAQQAHVQTHPAERGHL